MGLDLFMVGVIVKDMPRALAFYRRLGVAVPEGADAKPHVQIKMGAGLTFFLDAQPQRWDPQLDTTAPPALDPAAARYPLVLEFYLKEQAALEAKFAELVAAGYDGFRAPYRNDFGMIFALVKDPDGNTILLSADPAA